MSLSKPTPASVRGRLKIEAEIAVEGWDEKVAPMPKRIVITIAKKNPALPADAGNVNATVEIHPPE